MFGWRSLRRIRSSLASASSTFECSARPTAIFTAAGLPQKPPATTTPKLPRPRISRERVTSSSRRSQCSAAPISRNLLIVRLPGSAMPAKIEPLLTVAGWEPCCEPVPAGTWVSEFDAAACESMNSAWQRWVLSRRSVLNVSLLANSSCRFPMAAEMMVQRNRHVSIKPSFQSWSLGIVAARSTPMVTAMSAASTSNGMRVHHRTGSAMWDAVIRTLPSMNVPPSLTNGAKWACRTSCGSSPTKIMK
mmetsp:Transcript_49182/g.138857  ORF Transcript_49182/g.138857 Transcript_49182/m.138857 type:complete len:247 (+) Transcript_49182:1000-1740(+)